MAAAKNAYGAGKTTTVRILATLLPFDAGLARMAGYDVAREPHRVRTRIRLAGQYAAVDERLTGRENLALVGTLYHLGRKTAAGRAAGLLDRFGLAEAADRQVKTYSGGMRRLDLAAAIIASPSVLFLDEPTTGLDPAARLELWQAVRDLRRGAGQLGAMDIAPADLPAWVEARYRQGWRHLVVTADDGREAARIGIAREGGRTW